LLEPEFILARPLLLSKPESSRRATPSFRRALALDRQRPADDLSAASGFAPSTAVVWKETRIDPRSPPHVCAL